MDWMKQMYHMNYVSCKNYMNHVNYMDRMKKGKDHMMMMMESCVDHGDLTGLQFHRQENVEMEVEEKSFYPGRGDYSYQMMWVSQRMEHPTQLSVTV